MPKWPLYLDPGPPAHVQEHTGIDLDDPDALVVGGITQFKRKTASESVTSSTTVQRDDHLHGFVLETSTRYEFELVLKYEGPNNGDLNLFLGDDTGAGFTTSLYGAIAIALHPGATGLNEVRNEPFLGSEIIGTIAGSQVGGFIKGNLFSGSQTSLALWWAQGTSHATATTILSESYMKVTKLS